MVQRSLGLLLTAFIFFGTLIVHAQNETGEQPEIMIVSPLPGQAVRGNLPILVDTTIEGFLSAELSFTYSNDETGIWFLIGQRLDTALEGFMAEWDTTTLTDGVYDLRLVVYLTDGQARVNVVPALRVRNYSPIETDTPTPSATPAPQATPLPTITPTPTATPVPPTPTSLPANPLQITQDDIVTNLFRGVAGGVALMVLAGFYLSFRKLFRK